MQFPNSNLKLMKEERAVCEHGDTAQNRSIFKTTSCQSFGNMISYETLSKNVSTENDRIFVIFGATESSYTSFLSQGDFRDGLLREL